MILIIGGIGAGKRAFVQTLGYSEDDMSNSHTSEKPVIYDTQELLRKYESAEVQPMLLSKEIVICNEVGSGVVPLEQEDRKWRESVGRLCCELAKEATAVVRVYCGIPQVLKGEL